MSATPGTPTLDVIVVAFGEEPLLPECIEAILGSQGLRIELTLVDNGCNNSVLERLAANRNVHVITSGTNIGFPAGVRRGAEHGANAFLAVINSDVIVEPDALAYLVQVASEPELGICMPQILRGDDGRINSAGNPLHVLGYSWAGKNGAVALPTSAPIQRNVAVVSGAAFVMRRDTWDALGGMPDEFFLYQEDVDLSLACHQAGLRIALVPAARVHHAYEWSRNPGKLYFAERNRLIVIFTRFPAPALVRILPPLLVAEVGMMIAGGLPGVRRAKVRAHLWIVRNVRWIRARRRRNLRHAVDATSIVRLLTPTFSSDVPVRTVGMRILNAFLPTYVRLIRLHKGSELRSE